MKIQHTNQTMIDSIASDNAWAVIDLINSGMSIDEACEAQVDSAMDEQYDDEQYDAPYDRSQLFAAYKKAVTE